MEESNASLASLFVPEVVKLTGKDVPEVLKELAAKVPGLLDAEREKLLAALLVRENQMSTGVGDGVALPHSRELKLSSINQPLVVFGCHEGLSYNAIDGQPVRLFLLLLTPAIESHLALLSRLSRLMRRAEVREALLTVETFEELAGALDQAE